MIPIIARYLLQVSLTIFRLVTLRSAYSSLLDAFSTCPSFSSAFSCAFVSWVTTAAQTSSTESKQQVSPDQSQTDSVGNMHRDGVGERLEWHSQHLNLTEDQKKQLKPILAGEFKQ